MASARITVERAKESVGIFRSYWVVIDGAKAGRVKRGSSLKVDVEPGKHELHLAVDWTRSRSVNLVLDGDEDALVRARARGNAFTAVFWGTFYPKRAIDVELVQPIPARA